jgi:hypothetical protein
LVPCEDQFTVAEGRPGRALLPVVLAAALAAACSDEPGERIALPTPFVGRATVVPGQPPVVWLAAQTEEVETDHLIVVEPGGSRVRLERLSADATRFFSLRDDAWRRMSTAEVELIEVGTPVCVESLLDETTFLALRVFIGAACGPAG